MKKKHLKRYSLLLISSITLTALTILACGGGDWYMDEGSMFSPHIINQPKYTPFFRTMETPFYDGYDDAGAEVFRKTNAEEWIGFLGAGVTEDGINYWLYEASINQVDSMIFDIKGKAANLTTKSKKYSLKTTAPAAKATSFLYYLGFAKRNESFAVIETDYGWNDKPAKVAEVSITKQISGGLNFYTKSTEPFLKERYAFQLVRLYFFNKEYDKAISFFNEQETAFRVNGSMKWRSLGYKAAALYRQKKYVESNYLYSVIYDQYQPLRKSAYLSFHPLAKAEWEQCLSATKSVKEKEVLWQLSGLHTDDILAMKEILKLNPASDMADLLLVRAVNSEEGLIGSGSYLHEDEDKKHSIDKNLLAFLNDMSGNTSSLNPVIWHFAAAYLNYLNNDFVLGDQQMKRAEKYKEDNAFNKSEYHLINALGKVRRMTVITEKEEKVLLPDLVVLYNKETAELKDFRSSNAKEWIRKSLATLFNQKGEIEKAELLYPGTNPEQFVGEENIKKMIAYYENPTKSAFEKLWFGNAFLTRPDYSELLAIRYTQQDRLEEAANVFKTIHEEVTLPGNPFTIHIRDCHDCDHEAVQKTKYSKNSFVNKMIEMKQTALAKPEEAAQNYFLVANGFYNMTYFGNARLFYDNRVDNSIYRYEHPLVPEEKNDLALKYYLLALQHATDKEFKARCTFMAAKCEQNTFFMNMPKDYKGDFKSGVYFASLKKEYASTKYYSEIIKECGYFKTYINSR